MLPLPTKLGLLCSEGLCREVVEVAYESSVITAVVLIHELLTKVRQLRSIDEVSKYLVDLLNEYESLLSNC